MTRRPILLAAGGTGGHLFPAEALAAALAARGESVALVSDRRVEGLSARFPGDVHSVRAATVTGKGLIGKVRSLAMLGVGFVESALLIRRLRPRAVVGFGGYPSVPPVLAASLLGVPTILQEQNAVMGRANRFLAGRVSRISTAFPKVQLTGAEAAEKCVMTGVPVRPAVIDASKTPYSAPTADGALRLVVFGGSQGARIFADVVPGAVARLDKSLIDRLEIVQQCRAEDIEKTRFAYDAVGARAELRSFFDDLPARIASAHLVIARSGASTVAELGVIGRPAILVPLPGAIDNDQLMNASAFVHGGAGWLVPQTSFNPTKLAELLRTIMAQAPDLADKAGKAANLGNADAAGTLADLVMTTAANQ
ncbi:MAG: undecaprenyldiphospho-muramoylpentapeptide beta-N-acetylglucosaminyltransferase [Rhodobiaceae bacterium]|nr:undecaprenyldiphospho-muramoylpentapeptide beta-N-acetylglucosaminyltransferase [Rhodobiaceae bacterium]MCC0055675.1 undecaprenyldiphospho-muramoylpentapeptide beta-N-acetylglucosaminyltransferase [Rhodobiaceae bacterium]